MVWLPGAYDAAEAFLEAGFDREVRSRALAVDLELVPLELDHVGDRSVIGQLEREILPRARASGCRSIWLAGISLGGFFALDYAATHPSDWDGLCLLAPYLGNRLLIAEIAAAPSPAAWAAGPLAELDEERRIWRFIQTLRREERPLYLGYGRNDRFAAAQKLMAVALAAGSARAMPGGHDWRTWVLLFRDFLDSGWI
ncbi:MAG TPA: alpha/beta hydrolase-fold protein [Steroidobacteraceae bacterium]|nr:alpha/beta hydrolase-fold protein [Steroidobacteraceae bacterium]